MGAEMDAIFVVLVCVSLIVLMLVVLWQNKTLTELWDRCADIEHRYGCALQKLIEVDRKIAQEITRLERTLRSSNAGNKKSGHDDIVDV